MNFSKICILNQQFTFSQVCGGWVLNTDQKEQVTQNGRSIVLPYAPFLTSVFARAYTRCYDNKLSKHTCWILNKTVRAAMGDGSLEAEGHSNVMEMLRSASALSSSCVDLTRRGITELPHDFPSCPKLEVSAKL